MRRIAAAAAALDTAETAETAETELNSAVAAAREARNTWAMIGTAVGISGQGARVAQSGAEEGVSLSGRCTGRILRHRSH
ncbi:hypothetical protein [Mycolicibacterium tusciae]|uniref:hypothetical protein n=1 Tax=Mycolicibacterium tusciae TaxID=75922 RepID=UPI00024A4005|nr:hypothetical protein [Mycolicibacterium tusciae]